MEKAASQKVVITIPMEVYFRLKEMGAPLGVKAYIELLLRNIAVREVKVGSLKSI